MSSSLFPSFTLLFVAQLCSDLEVVCSEMFFQRNRLLHINSYDVLRNMMREAMQVSKEVKCRTILMQSESLNFNFSMKKKGA